MTALSLAKPGAETLLGRAVGGLMASSKATVAAVVVPVLLLRRYSAHGSRRRIRTT